jgi:hypothetical protein
MPSAACTMGFGAPVVPEEYKMYTGWSGGKEAKSSCLSDAAVEAKFRYV